MNARQGRGARTRAARGRPEEKTQIDRLLWSLYTQQNPRALKQLNKYSPHTALSIPAGER